LEADFKGRFNDIKAGLNCKIELAQERYNEALGWLEKTKDKNPAYLFMRLEAIKGLLRKAALPDAQRISYQKMIPVLEAELAGKRAIPFGVTAYE